MDIIKLIDLMCKMTGSLWVSQITLKQEAMKRHVSLDGLKELVKKNAVFFCNYEDAGYFTTAQAAITENVIANNIVRILSARPFYLAESVINKKIDLYEQENQLKLDEMQRKAVVTAVKHNLCIVTGGPGTGKTAVIKCISYVLSALLPKQTISFAAPTGKAAKRITESTGQPAATLNSDLCIGINEYSPKPIYDEISIVDEFSMVDAYLAAALFSSIQTGNRLIICGDVDQLPSVGPGCVLLDMITSGVVPCVMLTKTFRQDTNSVLFENISKIKEGRTDLKNGPDFQMYKVGQAPIDQLRRLYVQLVRETNPKTGKPYGVYDVGCLIPFRRAGVICSDNLNRSIQERCNTNDAVDFYGRTFKLYSPVIQMANRPGVANGDTGKIVGIDKNELKVNFGDCEVTYDSDSVWQIELAHAISIHKSQGSEYPAVIMALTNEHTVSCNRNIFYTGITRAKQRCVLLYEDEALKIAASRNGNSERKTMLCEKIKYVWQRYQLVKHNSPA